MGTCSQRGLTWPHYKGEHVNSPKYRYCLAGRAAFSSRIVLLSWESRFLEVHQTTDVVFSYVGRNDRKYAEQFRDSKTEFQRKIKKKKGRPRGSMHMQVLHRYVPSASIHLFLVNQQALGGCMANFLIQISSTQMLCKGDWLLQTFCLTEQTNSFCSFEYLQLLLQSHFNFSCLQC